MNNIKAILYNISYFLVSIISLALVVYFIKFLEKDQVPGFEMAIISAIFGGFMLSSSIYGSAATDLKLRMRRIGAMYLIAAVSFVIFSIFHSISDILPEKIIMDNITFSNVIDIDIIKKTNIYIKPQTIVAWIWVITMVIGAWSFAIAIWLMLIQVIPRLFIRSKNNIV